MSVWVSVSPGYERTGEQSKTERVQRDRLQFLRTANGLVSYYAKTISRINDK
jgi:hypothetical protein